MNIIQNLSSVKISTNSIYPELQFCINIETEIEREAIIFGNAGLFTADGKRIGELKLVEEANNNINYHLSTIDSNYEQRNNPTLRPDKKSQPFIFYSALSKEAIDHIEEVRMSTKTKQVDFTIKFVFQNFRPNGNLIYALNNEAKLRPESTRERVQFLFSSMVSDRCHFTISQSQWIQEFAEPLKIGKFLLLELNIPSTINGPGTNWEEPIKRALKNLQKVEGFLLEGKWYDAIETSRKISELFKYNVKKNEIDKKNKEELKKLFLEVNLSDKGFDQLCSMIENLFHFISKFEHEKDEQGHFLPTPVPQKEDAYFIYSTSIALVNMISNKIKDKT